MKNTIFLIVILAVSMMTTVSGQKGDKTSAKIVITGTVTGLDGKAVPGAQIFIDSVGTGITTDDFGKYKVKTNPGAKIVFAYSFMCGSGEAAIDGRTKVDIKLDPRKDTRPDFKSLPSQASEGSASAKTKKANTYTNIFDMIRQEVPGVLVSGSSVVVQQQNSFYGSSAPLFIVNGVRVSSIGNINPREVKSIVLLKGSQANIYGSEGANGVLSITLISGADN